LNWKLAMLPVFVVGLLVGAVAHSTAVNIYRIQNVGTIKSVGVEVYADEALTQILIEITWGTLDPGETRNASAWIKNTGNDELKLVLWTENWNPTDAQNSISLSWNYTDTLINAGDSIPVDFILTVNLEICGVSSFSFDIWVKGVA
jgi:hypothetical protein